MPALVDLVDVDSQKWFQYAAKSRGVQRWLYRIEGPACAAWNNRCRRGQRPSRSSAIAEAELFRSFCPADAVYAIPNGVDLDYFQPGQDSDSLRRKSVSSSGPWTTWPISRASTGSAMRSGRKSNAACRRHLCPGRQPPHPADSPTRPTARHPPGRRRSRCASLPGRGRGGRSSRCESPAAFKTKCSRRWLWQRRCCHAGSPGGHCRGAGSACVPGPHAGRMDRNDHRPVGRSPSRNRLGRAGRAVRRGTSPLGSPIADVGRICLGCRRIAHNRDDRGTNHFVPRQRLRRAADQQAPRDAPAGRTKRGPVGELPRLASPTASPSDFARIGRKLKQVFAGHEDPAGESARTDPACRAACRARHWAKKANRRLLILQIRRALRKVQSGPAASLVVYARYLLSVGPVRRRESALLLRRRPCLIYWL